MPSTLFKLVTKRFFTTFICVFLFVDGIAWFRHAVEHRDNLRFLSADFLPFSLAVFTTGLPSLLLISAIIVLMRMQTSRETDMLRTFAVPGSVVVNQLSHCFKVLLVLLFLSREILVPHARWDMLRVLLPGKTGKLHTIAMKTDEGDILAKVSGNYRTIKECHVWRRTSWETFTNLRFEDGRWLKEDGSAVELPSPSAIALSNPRSLEFMSAAELASLAAQSELRRSYLTTLFLEHFSLPVFFYLLALLFCRIFIRRNRNILHATLSSFSFILVAYLTMFAVRHVSGEFNAVWLQVLAAFTPSLILTIILANPLAPSASSRSNLRVLSL